MGIRPKASCMADKGLTTEFQPQQTGYFSVALHHVNKGGFCYSFLECIYYYVWRVRLSVPVCMYAHGMELLGWTTVEDR